VTESGGKEESMSHPSSQVETVNGVEIKASSFRTNAFVYRSIGGSVQVRGEKRSRDWRCAWLCKKREKVKAGRILLENHYFTRLDGTAVLVTAAQHDGQCTDATDCTLKHSAGGIAVKIKFPGGDTSPGTIDDLLPLEGVVSRATVSVEGRQFTFVTASGAHPG
jgi:hypothetical protein